MQACRCARKLLRPSINHSSVHKSQHLSRSVALTFHASNGNPPHINEVGVQQKQTNSNSSRNRGVAPPTNLLQLRSPGSEKEKQTLAPPRRRPAAPLSPTKHKSVSKYRTAERNTLICSNWAFPITLQTFPLPHTKIRCLRLVIAHAADQATPYERIGNIPLRHRPNTDCQIHFSRHLVKKKTITSAPAHDQKHTQNRNR